MAEKNQNQGQSSKSTKRYEDAAGNTVELDHNDPSTADRVARGELREVTDTQR